MNQEELKEQIKPILEELISQTWVELLDDKPEVMYADHDIEIASNEIMSLLARANCAIIHSDGEVERIK